ncbi:transposase [Streptomyces sp. V4I2]|uniref:transposase n=1 Tax=Streptomyces sp. V4I2 TaxID=3042280 RepID=UPI002789A19A|nr:transposase [Streptomyces sp. V4I2]MDQ1051360.1 hypothetical protein [Streptomyces sp. V4I2]
MKTSSSLRHWSGRQGSNGLGVAVVMVGPPSTTLDNGSIWDNLNVHRCSRLREYAAEHDWLTIVQLPSYAPDLNPVEGIWSLLRRSTTANVVFRDRDHLVQAVRGGLRRIQQRTDLIEGCLAETGLLLNTTTERKGQ